LLVQLVVIEEDFSDLVWCQLLHYLKAFETPSFDQLSQSILVYWVMALVDSLCLL
jgi:hypothetical protein